MKGDRRASNNTTRRMDEKHGSRDKDGRRSDHSVNQEDDKEREKDRSSSGEGIEEQREGMGKRGRNDNLEKPDLCAKGSDPTRRHNLSPSQ